MPKQDDESQSEAGSNRYCNHASPDTTDRTEPDDERGHGDCGQPAESCCKDPQLLVGKAEGAHRPHREQGDQQGRSNEEVGSDQTGDNHDDHCD